MPFDRLPIAFLDNIDFTPENIGLSAENAYFARDNNKDKTA
jgi:hypothetical protein